MLQALLIIVVVMLASHWWDAKHSTTPAKPKTPRPPAGPLWWCGAVCLTLVLSIASASIIVHHV